MSNETFVWALAIGAGSITLLDVLDRWTTRGEREPLRAGTFWFLLGMTLVFLAIQVGLTLLFPQIPDLSTWARAQVAGWTQATGAVELSGWRVAAIVVPTFFVGGLIDYVTHRFFNHSPTFWWTHEYHHLPNDVFVLLPGLMVRPFAAFSSVAVALITVGFAYGLVWALGWPLADLLPALKIMIFVQLMILMTSHSCFLRRFWGVHYVMRALLLTTPQEHLIHHTTDRPGNYGNTTTIWDRLFGTYRDPLLPENQNRPLGLAYDQDFLGVVTFGRLRLPPAWRARFQLDRYCNLTPAKPRAHSGGQP